MRLVIVTGLSGAGKSTAMKMLEDAQYFCVDNLPIQLVGKFVSLMSANQGEDIQNAAIGLDVRSGRYLEGLEEVLDQGKDIVFLTLGDPTIYSTFSYLQKRVEDDGYETALVSGITSFCAAAARTNQPLVEWNQTLHIVPAVHRLGDTPDAEGNYVFMKSGKKMKQVKEILRETGKQVSMVENCGMETEHVYRSVDEIPDDSGYFSLIIAKEMESGK